MCVCAVGREGQAKNSLPHLCMNIMQWAGRVRVHVALRKCDTSLHDWLMVTFEALILSKQMWVLTADREDWHDAEWKSAVHREAITQGATVVPRE